MGQDVRERHRLLGLILHLALAQIAVDRIVEFDLALFDELHRRHPLRPWLAEISRLPRVVRVELEPFTTDEVGEQLEAILDRSGPHARTIMHEHVLAFQRAILTAFSRR